VERIGTLGLCHVLSVVETDTYDLLRGYNRGKIHQSGLIYDWTPFSGSLGETHPFLARFQYIEKVETLKVNKISSLPDGEPVIAFFTICYESH
jgi:hypothetical protein